MATIQVKRIYQAAEKADGLRILVDRLWPRGIKKEVAQIDEWMKDIAPSTALRQRFHSDWVKWEEFVTDYRFELKQNPVVKHLLELVRKNETVTLLYAVRDEQQNHAILLREFINDQL